RSPLLALLQPRPQFHIPLRTRREALNQRPQIEAGPARHHRQMTASGNFFQNFPPCPGKISCRKYLIRIGNIDQMMRDALPLGKRQFGGPDIEIMVDLNRIAVQDLTLEMPGDMEREAALSRPRGSGNRQQTRNIWQRLISSQRYTIMTAVYLSAAGLTRVLK